MNAMGKMNIRVFLEELRDELAGKVNGEIAVEACADDNEYASRLTGQSLTLALRSRDLRRVRDIEAALSRLDSLDYGACEECGEDISVARLRLDPAVRYCVACQEDFDRVAALAV